MHDDDDDETESVGCANDGRKQAATGRERLRKESRRMDDFITKAGTKFDVGSRGRRRRR